MLAPADTLWSQGVRGALPPAQKDALPPAQKDALPPAQKSDSAEAAKPSLARAAMAHLTYKVAQSPEEREAAFRLLHRGYVEKGLMPPNEYGMRVTPAHLVPSTQVYIALEGEEVLYTMSLVLGSDTELPLEALYRDEVGALRAAGRNVAEVTCLTSSQKYDKKLMYAVFARLVSLMFQQARHLGIDGLLIAVHPKHASFYGRQLGFVQYGPEKRYALVGDKPAVLCFHDFEMLDVVGYPLFDQIYGRAHAQAELTLQLLPPAERERFAPIAEVVASDHTAMCA